MFIPPIPTPDEVHGFHLIVEYDVDEHGKVIGADFTPTKEAVTTEASDYLKTFSSGPERSPTERRFASSPRSSSISEPVCRSLEAGDFAHHCATCPGPDDDERSAPHQPHLHRLI